MANMRLESGYWPSSFPRPSYFIMLKQNGTWAQPYATLARAISIRQKVTRRSCKAEMDAGAFRLPGEVFQRRACSGSHPAPAQPPLLGRRLCRAAACNTFAHTGRRALRAASLLPGVSSCELATRVCATGGGIGSVTLQDLKPLMTFSQV